MPTPIRNAADHAEDVTDDAMSQIARLREQVETLMRDTVRPAVGEAAERAEAVAHEAADALRGRADALAGVIREQPLTAICIAAILGFVLGRAGR
jgi:ElaB/YqjD/DUF883 family membrane-anchored ribosome-binding protein